MAISRSDFSRQASFIAGRASGWAADSLYGDNALNPMSDVSVQRFLADMRERLDIVERMHLEGDKA